MAKIGRPRAVVVITDSERTELERLTKRAHVNRAVAFRARVVLACADGITDKAIARRLPTTKTTVAKWRLRFHARRLAGVVRRASGWRAADGVQRRRRGRDCQNTGDDAEG